MRRLPRQPAAGDNGAVQSDPPKADTPKRKRRWFQFSLRSLLIFTLICAVACGWVARRAAQKRRQLDAIASLLKMGAYITYDFQYDSSGQSIPGARPPGPEWLRNLFGENFLSDVKYVYIPSQTKPDPNAAAKHWWQKALAVLAPEPPPDADAALATCEEFPNLKDLVLSETTVSDRGLAHLDKLSQLRSLELSETTVSDAGLAHVKGLIHLRRLDVSVTDDTDGGMICLSELNELRALDVAWTKVGDAGLAHVNGLLHLRELDLNGTNTTDAGMAYLSELSELEVLHLSRTKIGDAGLEHLKRCLLSRIHG